MKKGARRFPPLEKMGYLNWLQRRIYQNKVAQGFNVAGDRNGVYEEIGHLVEELGELAAAHRRGKRRGVINGIIDSIVFHLGLLEILGADGDKELEKVLRQNERRRYRRRRDGSYVRIK